MDLAQAGIAGAEVVEGDAEVQFAKAADGALGLGQTLDGGGFVDFQVEAGRVERLRLISSTICWATSSEAQSRTERLKVRRMPGGRRIAFAQQG